MSKRKKSGGKATESYLNLTAAILNLITALLLLWEKLTGGGEGEGNLPLYRITKRLRGVKDGYFDILPNWGQYWALCVGHCAER